MLNRILFGLCILIIVCCAALIAYSLSQPSNDTQNGPFSPDNYRAVRVIEEPLDPIRYIPTIAAYQVIDQVSDAELVLGVEIDGKARAYPINQLNGPTREVFNDELGGQAIAATW